MAHIFSHKADRVVLGIALTLPLVLLSVVGAVWYWWSPDFTDVGYQPAQPVPFSHALHAGELGLDCRYCHSSVEVAGMAAVPATETCMNCHKFVGADREVLEPVRASLRDDTPIEWVRVHMLPDYAFFDHSVHVAASVGCATCHGRIDRMEVVTQHASLSMGWCLECHRDPQPNLRPRAEVTNMGWDAGAAGYDPTTDPARTRPASELAPPTHCSGCHR